MAVAVVGSDLGRTDVCQDIAHTHGVQLTALRYEGKRCNRCCNRWRLTVSSVLACLYGGGAGSPIPRGHVHACMVALPWTPDDLFDELEVLRSTAAAAPAEEACCFLFEWVWSKMLGTRGVAKGL